MTLAVKQRSGGFHGRVDHAVERDALLLEDQLALRDPCYVKQVIKQKCHMLDLALNDATSPLQSLASHVGRSEYLGGVADRSQRVSKLVRQSRQEHIFSAI